MWSYEPNNAVLAADECDFEGELWTGNKEVVVSLTNWDSVHA